MIRFGATASPPTPAWNAPPSSYAVYDLVTGKPGAIPRALALTAARSIFIMPGLYLAGVRGWKVVTASLFASVGITLGMAGIAAWQAHQNEIAAASNQPPVGNPLNGVVRLMGAGT